MQELEIFDGSRWVGVSALSTVPPEPVLRARAHALHAAVAERHSLGPVHMAQEARLLEARVILRAEVFEAWLLRPAAARPAVTPTGGLPDVDD